MEEPEMQWVPCQADMLVPEDFIPGANYDLRGTLYVEAAAVGGLIREARSRAVRFRLPLHGQPRESILRKLGAILAEDSSGIYLLQLSVRRHQ